MAPGGLRQIEVGVDVEMRKRDLSMGGCNLLVKGDGGGEAAGCSPRLADGLGQATASR